MNIPKSFDSIATLFFELLESQFILRDISDSSTKLGLLLLSLNQCQLELLQEKISNIWANFVDPYNEIKTLLLKSYVRSYSERLGLFFQSSILENSYRQDLQKNLKSM